MAEKKQPDAAGQITTAQAAKLLMVSEAWIGKLHKMEYVPKAARGKWNLVAVVQGYIRFLKDEDRRSSKSASHSRMTDIKAERLEMQMKAERRELVPFEDTRLVLDTAAGLMQSSLMSIPAKFTRDIAERRRLEGMIAQALNDIADGMEKKAEALKKGGDVLE
jgi:phage terminase Nu1 subunit (DNA packaging protein)